MAASSISGHDEHVCLGCRPHMRSRNHLRDIPVIVIGPCIAPWPGTVLPYSLPPAQRRARALNPSSAISARRYRFGHCDRGLMRWP
jgi:hypothetical protein